MTMPTTASVFRTVQPRSSRFSLCSPAFFPLSCVMQPRKRLRSLLGLSHSMTLVKVKGSNSETSSEKPRTTCRRFRLVSPSRLAVSMWHRPSGSLEDSSRMSAGMISLQRSRTKSPTRISLQKRFTYCFSSLLKTKQSRWLISRSERWRL